LTPIPLDMSGISPYNSRVHTQKMSRPLIDKFRRHLPVLEQTVRRECDLDIQHPKIYKKLYRFFAEQGVEFYDNPDDDYELVIDCLETELRKTKTA
tara:strand:+ start:78 stop:365 length:288 start_codon:yes stop_codon:yes gene_type:complete